MDMKTARIRTHRTLRSSSSDGPSRQGQQGNLELQFKNLPSAQDPVYSVDTQKGKDLHCCATEWLSVGLSINSSTLWYICDGSSWRCFLLPSPCQHHCYPVLTLYTNTAAAEGDIVILYIVATTLALALQMPQGRFENCGKCGNPLWHHWVAGQAARNGSRQ